MIHRTCGELGVVLGANECVLWRGKPAGGLHFRASDTFLIPFSALCFAFAVFWELQALRGRVPFFFALWGVPFICIGLYLAIGKFVYDVARRRRTEYLVTSERVVIASGLMKPRVTSLFHGNLASITLEKNSHGLGTLTFGPVPTHSSVVGDPSWPGMLGPLPPQFELIPNAPRVHEMVLRLQREPLPKPLARGILAA